MKVNKYEFKYQFFLGRIKASGGTQQQKTSDQMGSQKIPVGFESAT